MGDFHYVADDTSVYLMLKNHRERQYCTRCERPLTADDCYASGEPSSGYCGDCEVALDM